MAVISDKIFGAARLIKVSASVEIMAMRYNDLYLIASLPSLHNNFIVVPPLLVLPVNIYFTIK
jgi:hypothetical protein